MGAAIALRNEHICIESTEPFSCHTEMRTKIKCAGSFDLFLTLNSSQTEYFLDTKR